MLASELDDAICRTATDALLAKYSAIVTAGYSLNVNAYPESTCGDKSAELESLISSQRSNVSSYETLLRSMTVFFLGSSPRRQSPLVNAGYAIRVACVLRQIKAFVSFHRHCNTNGEIQLIILGAGLDVTGLWSLTLVDEAIRNPSTGIGIRVVEIDFPNICISKQRAIQSMQLLDHRPNNRDCSSPISAWHANSKTNVNAIYTLISANLTDTLLMDSLFSNPTLIDPNIPTFILSELVLAYVSTESCDKLLHRFATLFGQRGSCTVLYEPLGPANPMQVTGSDTDRKCAPVSILESYKASYYNKFNSKLQKGFAKKQPLGQVVDESHLLEVDNQSLYPLGSSCGHVTERMRGLGYEHVHCTLPGIVALSMQLMDWKANELFDEHAALALHLSSYTVVCAFPKASTTIPIVLKQTNFDSQTIDTYLFRRVMCPWISSAGFMRYPIPILVNKSDSENHSTWITSIQKEDEKQVRHLFSLTYNHLFDKYPSIRKMVKMALRKDLGVSDGNNATYNRSSNIGTHYEDAGGDFLVAVQYNSQHSHTLQPIKDDSISVDTSKTKHTEKQPWRQVLGGIGIRKCTTEECIARSVPSDTVCYEINRFFVDTSYRCRGIGTKIWNQVLDMIDRRQQVRQQRLRHCQRIRYCIIATTPTILVPANRFYTKHGFDIQSEIETGGLTMRTYVKTI
jgi:O-methyltransferase involved in polyketide biosynthesis/ribosomal protein S18 acetylase RimI-like enzyme